MMGKIRAYEEIFAGCMALKNMDIRSPKTKFGANTFGVGYPPALIPQAETLLPHLADSTVKSGLFRKEIWDELSPELCGAAVYILQFQDQEKMTAETKKAVYAALKAVPKGADAHRKLEADEDLMRSLNGEEERELSLFEKKCAAVAQKSDVSRFALELRVKEALSLPPSELPDILLRKYSTPAPEDVLPCLLLAELQNDRPGRLPETAALAEELGESSLQRTLLALGKQHLGDYTRWINLASPICHTADEDTMRVLTVKAPAWRSGMSGIDAPPLRTFRMANRYSNTHAAMMFAERYNELGKYAALRGLNEDTLCERALMDSGLDADGTKTFDLGNGTLTGAPVAVAHPMEMDAGLRAKWQGYLLERGLRQPFLQMWESVADLDHIAPDRYKGCMIPYGKLRFADCTTVEDFDFHEEIIISFAGCKTDVERIDSFPNEINSTDRFEVVSVSVPEKTREASHSIAWLDYTTAADRVARDDVTIRDLLPIFTLQQIADFTALASESGSTNCTALLLDYKNKTYPDADPLAEFTLDLL